MVKRDDERVVARGQYLLLRKRALDLVSLNHFFLAQDYLIVSLTPCFNLNVRSPFIA